MLYQDFFFEYKKYKLYGQYWVPKGCKAIVLLVHGMGEHSSRYADFVIPELLAKHMAVITYDNFGHGKSSGKRGHCPGYQSLMEVLDLICHKAQEIDMALPIFLYGHSMGGNLVLNYVVRKKPKIQGAVVTSPLLQLAFQPSKWKLVLGKLFLTLIPSFTLTSGLDVKMISKDIKEIEKYINDPLIHDKISPNFSLPVMKAGNWVLNQAQDLKIPVLLVHGAADQITSCEASREFAKNTELAKFIEFKNGYHELHNDSEKEKLMTIITNWIQNKI